VGLVRARGIVVIFFFLFGVVRVSAFCVFFIFAVVDVAIVDGLVCVGTIMIPFFCIDSVVVFFLCVEVYVLVS